MQGIVFTRAEQQFITAAVCLTALAIDGAHERVPREWAAEKWATHMRNVAEAVTEEVMDSAHQKMHAVLNGAEAGTMEMPHRPSNPLEN